MARDSELIPEIHAAIKAILEERGMSQSELARAMDVSQKTVSVWVNGPTAEGAGGPTLAKLPLIEEAMGVWKGEILRRAGSYWFFQPFTVADVIRAAANELPDEEARERAANYWLLELEKARSPKSAKGRSAKIKDAAS
jgi:transcriptional regulator with XRE-family HTH domain